METTTTQQNLLDITCQYKGVQAWPFIIAMLIIIAITLLALIRTQR